MGNRQLLHGFFRIGVMLGVCGLILALFQPRDSGEFVVSICSAVLGGLLMAGVVIVMRLTRLGE